MGSYSDKVIFAIPETDTKFLGAPYATYPDLMNCYTISACNGPDSKRLQTMSGETMKEMKNRRVKNAEIRKRNRENYSQLCEVAIKMSVSLNDLSNPQLGLLGP